MDCGKLTFAEISSQLGGSTAYKFEVVEGNVQLKVDGLMGSLKRNSDRKAKPRKCGKRFLLKN